MKTNSSLRFQFYAEWTTKYAFFSSIDTFPYDQTEVKFSLKICSTKNVPLNLKPFDWDNCKFADVQQLLQNFMEKIINCSLPDDPEN